MKTLIAIVGPTATGKSDLAVWIARRIGGEVISADSRQIYKGLDIATGKITKREMQGVPHHLLDVANPKRQFSVAQYKRLAEKAIADIIKRGKIPILCGGTGFYVDAVLYDITLPEVAPNKKLRATLSKKSADELFSMLQKLDPVRAKDIDRHNPRRLIRAIEIAKALGKVPRQKQKKKYDALVIGLDMPDIELKKRIHKRVVTRMKKGMVAEAKRLHTQGLSWKRMNELGLEYRSLAQYLQNNISKEELVRNIEHEDWLYAKRQRTWFRKNKEVVWIAPNQKKKIAKLLTK